MSESDKHLFPWQHPCRDCNPISQQPSTPVGLPPPAKNGEDRSRTFWAHQTRTTSTNRKQFWHSGSPEVITDGAIRHKTKFLIFSSGGTICLSRVVLELKREKEIEKKQNWLLWQCPLRDRKSSFRPFIYSHSGNELSNSETAWKSIQWKLR